MTNVLRRQTNGTYANASRVYFFWALGFANITSSSAFFGTYFNTLIGIVTISSDSCSLLVTTASVTGASVTLPSVLSPCNSAERWNIAPKPVAAEGAAAEEEVDVETVPAVLGAATEAVVGEPTVVSFKLVGIRTRTLYSPNYTNI